MISLAADLVNALRSSVSWASLVNLLLQATTLCLAGRLALLLASRASAAFRHLVAWTAPAALVALPLVIAVPKPWASWSLAASWLPTTSGVAAQSRSQSRTDDRQSAASMSEPSSPAAHEPAAPEWIASTGAIRTRRARATRRARRAHPGRRADAVRERLLV